MWKQFEVDARVPPRRVYAVDPDELGKTWLSSVYGSSGSPGLLNSFCGEKGQRHSECHARHGGRVWFAIAQVHCGKVVAQDEALRADTSKPRPGLARREAAATRLLGGC